MLQVGFTPLGSRVSFLYRLLRRRPNVDKLVRSGKELVAQGEYEAAGNCFEQAAIELITQNHIERAIENFMAAGRVFRNINTWKAARCFLRAAHMYGNYLDNYEEAFKCYETAFRAFEKTKREREAQLATGYMILTQIALTHIDKAVSLTRGKSLSNKGIPGLANAALLIIRGQSPQIPDLNKFKESEKLITTALHSARAFSAVQARLHAKLDEVVVAGENLEVSISFQTTQPVTVTALDLFVTNHAKQISEINPNPPFTVDGQTQVTITLTLTLAGELSIGPVTYHFVSDGISFSKKTVKPLKIRVQPPKAYVAIEFTQQRSYMEENEYFVEGTIEITNNSKGVVELVEIELHPPPQITLVGTSQKKSINMIVPRRSVSFPVLLKSQTPSQQTIPIVIFVDQAPIEELDQFTIQFEKPEPDTPPEEDTDWVKELQPD